MIFIQEVFSPTYLYIKRHLKTGLLYLGKTTESEYYLLNEYKGSGEYWENHLKEHGEDQIETIWYCLFYDKDELVKFALMISEIMDIVNLRDINGKKIWANLRYENGLDGTPKGTKFSEQHRQNMAKAAQRRDKPSQQTIDKINHTKKINGTTNSNTPEAIAKRILKTTGRRRTEDQKQKMRKPKFKTLLKQKI